MNITFRQLQLFRALVATGSVSGAAREAGVTQPTASIHLRELAEEIGLPLYEVIGRTVNLTEAGRELATTARRLGCASVAFTYNDPTVFMEYAIDVADAWQLFVVEALDQARIGERDRLEIGGDQIEGPVGPAGKLRATHRAHITWQCADWR